MTKPLPKRNAQILEEASTWFIDFNEGEVDLAGREEFNTWLRRSPEHVHAFLQVSAFWEDARAFSKGRNLGIDELIARAKSEQNIYPLELTAHTRTQEAISVSSEESAGAEKLPHERRGAKRRWLAAASVVIALGIGALIGYGAYRAPTYATEFGEQRSITLEDGSSVELNSRSRIKVRYTATERSVELLEGQALFTVAKNPARPFIVATGDTRVRAVGTQFDVYRKHAGTVVTVVEGRVVVAPNRSIPLTREVPLSAANQRRGLQSMKSGEVLLGAGEQLVVTPATVELPKPANVAVATAWTEKKLVFESAPLREVVEEFNRYNREQLVIRDPALYEFHVSGVFSSTDSSRMIEFLRQRFGVTMNRSRDEIEISRRETSKTLPDAAPF